MNKQFPALDPENIKKLQCALSAGSEELFHLLLDPDPEFLQTLFRNPRFNEDHLHALLKRRDLPEELITRIYQRYKASISHKIFLSIVKHPSTSGVLLRSLLPQLRLFELVDILYLPGATPDQKVAAERIILQRLPTTPLGNKITLARRGTANIVAELLKDGQPQLFEACLGSARLNEAAIYQFLRSSTATAETISMVARHNRWKQRPNLRLAILKNHKTPEIWMTLWLPRMHTHVLKQLLAGCRSNAVRMRLIKAELKKRSGG